MIDPNIVNNTPTLFYIFMMLVAILAALLAYPNLSKKTPKTAKIKSAS